MISQIQISRNQFLNRIKYKIRGVKPQDLTCPERSRGKKQKGFTLIELLIYMAIFSTLLAVMTDIITSSLQIQLETKATSTVQTDGSYIISKLEYDLHRAKKITAPAGLGNTNSTPELTLNISGKEYTYSVINDDLHVISDDTDYVLNSYDSRISGFNIERIGNSTTTSDLDTVQINFMITSKTKSKSGNEQRTYRTTIGLRCYSTNCL